MRMRVAGVRCVATGFVLAATALMGCGGDDGGSASTSTTERVGEPTTTVASSGAASTEPATLKGALDCLRSRGTVTEGGGPSRIDNYRTVFVKMPAGTQATMFEVDDSAGGRADARAQVKEFEGYGDREVVTSESPRLFLAIDKPGAAAADRPDALACVHAATK